MNNQYVGDVGDFTKVGLLRLMSRSAEDEGRNPGWAVLWWATQDAGGTAGDGRHVSYLEDPAFVAADPELVRGLRMVHQAGRAIRSLETLRTGRWSTLLQEVA